MTSLFIIVGALVFQGCTHLAQTPASPPMPPPIKRSSTLAMEAQAETKSLRAALATERIKTAKQAAVVQSSRRKAATLKTRELEHSETISRLKTELASLKTERDTLRVEVSKLQAKTASAPKVLQLVTQMRTIETSLTGFSSSIETLSEDIASLRDEVELQKLASTSPSTPKDDSLVAEDMVDGELIVVKRGDSLWSLSKTYGTTVSELKALNGLTHNTIVLGQFLKISPDAPFSPEELVEIPNTKDHPTP